MRQGHQQIARLIEGQRRQPPVVEDQKLDTDEGLEEAHMPSIAARERKASNKPWHAIVEHRSIVTACLVCERAGKPTFAECRFCR